MMWVRFQFEDKWLLADTSRPISLAHQIVPNAEPTVSAFHLSPATSSPVEAGDFVGDTRQGGSVNCEVLQISPHGNGTHTEGVGHITQERIPVTNALPAPLMLIVLLDVSPVRLKDTKEIYSGNYDGDDLVVTAKALEEQWQKAQAFKMSPPALLVRACGEFIKKRNTQFSGKNPPYFTDQAMHWVRAMGATHFLTDVPSIDREDDGGDVCGHRIFWDLKDASSKPSGEAKGRTITELCNIPPSLEEGVYLLNLQVPPIQADAIPSWPMLYETQIVDE
jgi:arylformamidase